MKITFTTSVLAACLLTACAPEHTGEFRLAVDGVSAQFQALRRLENEMSRAPTAERREEVRVRWRENRARIDELLARGRDVAHSDDQQLRLGQLAALAMQADLRVAQIQPLSQLKREIR